MSFVYDGRGRVLRSHDRPGTFDDTIKIHSNASTRIDSVDVYVAELNEAGGESAKAYIAGR